MTVNFEKIAKTLKYCVISCFCLIHMAAITWWSLPQSFGELAADNGGGTFGDKVVARLTFNDHPELQSLFKRYIDLTGSQQYWDFFAPHSPRYHQYLSVCSSIETDQAIGKISCKGPSGFSNLDADFDGGTRLYRVFGSDRSRDYRLTENLSKLENPAYFDLFTRYYAKKIDIHSDKPAYLVLHLFELHPELTDLPKPGYRMDKVLWIAPAR